MTAWTLGSFASKKKKGSPACLKKDVFAVSERKPKYIEDITCPRVDMNFIFEWSTRYLTSERSERVSYRIEHEKIKFISISGHVIFCLLYKLTYDDIIDFFPKISDHFLEISED